MNYQVALNFEDGITQFIEVNEGELVADAAYRQGVNVPLDCRDGACGTCKCFAETGQYDLGQDYIEDALTVEEAKQGFVLTCQMRVTSDCVLQIPTTATLCNVKPKHYTATLTTLTKVSDSAFIITLSSEGFKSLSFLPGQYVRIKIPNTDQTRAYSFSSLLENNKISFLIRNVPNGLMSQYLNNQAKIGDILEVEGPLGSFYLREVQRPLLFIAGGTGLAPFLAMLEKLANNPPIFAIQLLYGVTNDSDLVELDKLEKFEKQIASFSFLSCVANTSSQHPYKGFVTDHIEPQFLYAGEVDIYLCGPPAMVEAVDNYIKKQGVSPKNFLYEKFAASTN